MGKSNIKKGYYRVKFYNHNRKMLMFFNGSRFESFNSDEDINDEIESYEAVDVEGLPNKEKSCPFADRCTLKEGLERGN